MGAAKKYERLERVRFSGYLRQQEGPTQHPTIYRSTHPHTSNVSMQIKQTDSLSTKRKQVQTSHSNSITNIRIDSNLVTSSPYLRIAHSAGLSGHPLSPGLSPSGPDPPPPPSPDMEEVALLGVSEVTPR